MKNSKINCIFEKYSRTLILMHLFFFPVVYTDQKEDCALHQLRPTQKGYRCCAHRCLCCEYLCPSVFLCHCHFCFHRSRGFTSRVESVMALQISHSAVSIKANNPPTLTANSFVIQSLLGCLPVSSFQTPPQRQGQSADWLVSPPRCGGTITMSLTGSRASLFCSTAFIHVDHNEHSGPCETLWPYEPCQLIVLLDISTLPVPGALNEVSPVWVDLLLRWHRWLCQRHLL